MTVDGVMSEDTDTLVKTIAKKIADKWEKPQGVVTAWVRAKIALALVRSCSACIRGARSRRNEWARLREHGFEDGAGMEQHLTGGAYDLDSLQAATAAPPVHQSDHAQDQQGSSSSSSSSSHARSGGWIGGHVDRPVRLP